MKDNTQNYEQAMRRLEEIAGSMERGEVSLDDMSARLREAQQLLQYCKECLYEAEKNCQTLLGGEGEKE